MTVLLWIATFYLGVAFGYAAACFLAANEVEREY